MPKFQTITADGGTLVMRAAMPPDSWNEAAGTVEVIFAADARMRRHTAAIGDFWEELSPLADEVDLRRLNTGGPVLNSHGKYDYAKHTTPGLENQVGTVISAWATGVDCRAIIRLINREDLAWVRRGVAEGDFQKLSCAYKVRRHRWIGDADDGLPIYRAIDWEPIEISLTTNSEDVGALVRSAASVHSVIYETPEANSGQTPMPPKPTTPSAAPSAANPSTQATARSGDPSATPAAQSPVVPGMSAPVAPIPAQAPVAADPVATRSAQLQVPGAPAAPPAAGSLVPTAPAGQASPETLTERQRIIDITRMGHLEGIPGGQELAQRAITDGTSVDAFRSVAFERMAAGGSPTIEANQHGAVHAAASVGTDAGMKFRSVLESSIEYQCNVPGAKLDGDSRAFAGNTLLRSAELYLQYVCNEDTRLYGPNEIVRRAMSSGDFPLLLANTANKRVIGAYEGVPRTFTQWARRSTANDFKTRSIVRLGAGSAPEKVPDTGEIPLGKLTESGETYRLFEYGRRYNLTRQMIVNDDKSVLDTIPARMGARMAELEGDIVYVLVSGNPTLSDGNTAFHANHGNLGSGVISIPNIGIGRSDMMKQTDEDGMKISPIARHFVVPPELLTLAQQMTGSIAPTQAGNVNPFIGQFASIQGEPRLTDAAAWYLFASPMLTESIEYAYLSGSETPQVLTDPSFESSGMGIRIVHAFGAGWTEFRGAWKSTG